MNNKMDRLYVKILGGFGELSKMEFVSIYHRPTHELLCFSSPQSLSDDLRRLESMSLEDFITECRKQGLNVRKMPLSVLDNARDKDRADQEHWLSGAWSYGTANAYKAYKLEHTQDDIYEFMEEWKRQERQGKKKGWDLSSSSNSSKKRRKRRVKQEKSKEETAVTKEDNSTTKRTKSISSKNKKRNRKRNRV